MPVASRRSITRDECLREFVALTRRIGEPVRAAELPDRLLKAIQRHFGGLVAARAAAGLAPRKRITKWSTERVLAEIRRVSRRGVRITYGGLEAAGQLALYRAIYFHIGSIKRARQLARVPEPSRGQRESEAWDADRVIEEIQSLHASGRSIALTKVDGRLVAAAGRYLGSWREAVTAAGFDYGRVRLVRVPYEEAEVLEQLRKLAARNPRMTVTELRRHRLFHAVKRFFGSIEAAALRLGIEGWPRTVQERCMRRSQVLALRARKRAGKSLRTTDLMREDFGLYRAAFAHVGSFQEAVRRAGGDPVVRRDWTRDAVLAELLRVAKATRWVTSGTVPQQVYRAAVKLFGSFDAARRAAGVPGPA